MGDLTRNFSRWEFDVHEPLPPIYAHKAAIHATLLQSFIDEVFVPHGWVQRPVIVNGCYRSPARNAAVGGAPGSSHLRADSTDVTFTGLSPRDAMRALSDAERQRRAPAYGLFMVYMNSSHFHISPAGVNNQRGLKMIRFARGDDRVVTGWREVPAKKVER